MELCRSGVLTKTAMLLLAMISNGMYDVFTVQRYGVRIDVVRQRQRLPRGADLL